MNRNSDEWEKLLEIKSTNDYVETSLLMQAISDMAELTAINKRLTKQLGDVVSNLSKIADDWK